jgi:hypothetical protein
MSFKKKKYLVIKNALSPEFSYFCKRYFIFKRQVANTLFKSKYISPFETMFGVHDDKQVPNTYSHYADLVMEVLLVELLPLMRKKTGLHLTPNYSYARIYKKGDILRRHKDRFSCEISTTLNLGGDPWPIYIDPTGKDSVINEQQNLIKPNAPKGIKVNLNPGDMLVYRGCELEHWREPFEGEDCVQVFLHYNNSATKGSEENLFDKRPHLGLPPHFKRK